MSCIMTMSSSVSTFDITNPSPALIPFGVLGLGIFTVVIVSITSKGIVFLGGIAAGVFFALFARHVFAKSHI